ncbi:MAG: hypothetical protein HUN05_13690 [Desulfobacter sp.]|nr:MAG: hypothetical protein HUN05_13690 [Desulfobacter sp.]
MDVLTAVDIQGDTKIETATMVSQALEASLDDFDNAARGCIGERKIKDI